MPLNCGDTSSGETTRPIALVPYVVATAANTCRIASALFAVSPAESTRLIVRVPDAVAVVESTQ
jgi:hypothetical protein